MEENILQRISKLCLKQKEAEESVAQAEEQLTQRKNELKEIQEVLLPELMEEMNINSLTTADGLVVTVQEKVRASISAKNQHEAFSWLRENDHSNLIKRQLSVDFTAGHEDEANDLYRQLASKYEVSDKSSVHPATLSSFVSEMLQNGETIPTEAFGVYIQKKSVIKTSK